MWILGKTIWVSAKKQGRRECSYSLRIQFLVLDFFKIGTKPFYAESEVLAVFYKNGETRAFLRNIFTFFCQLFLRVGTNPTYAVAKVFKCCALLDQTVFLAACQRRSEWIDLCVSSTYAFGSFLIIHIEIHDIEEAMFSFFCIQ